MNLLSFDWKCSNKWVKFCDIKFESFDLIRGFLSSAVNFKKMRNQSSGNVEGQRIDFYDQSAMTSSTAGENS